MIRTDLCRDWNNKIISPGWLTWGSVTFSTEYCFQAAGLEATRLHRRRQTWSTTHYYRTWLMVTWKICRIHFFFNLQFICCPGWYGDMLHTSPPQRVKDPNPGRYNYLLAKTVTVLNLHFCTSLLSFLRSCQYCPIISLRSSIIVACSVFA